MTGDPTPLVSRRILQVDRPATSDGDHRGGTVLGGLAPSARDRMIEAHAQSCRLVDGLGLERANLLRAIRASPACPGACVGCRSLWCRDRLPVELAVSLDALGHLDGPVGGDVAQDLRRPATRPVDLEDRDLLGLTEPDVLLER